MKRIQNFEDFLENLYYAGLSLGGENSEGIFTLCDYFNDNVVWHTGEPETDPWEWRMRVLNEKSDIAYGKIFFKKSGYITKEWYSYFYAVRRGNNELQDEYEEGKISLHAKKIYELLCEYRELPIHLIKRYGGFSKEDKTMFDNAVTELQMKFYISMCGRARKKSKSGEEFGWSSTVFCLEEDFFDEEVIKAADKIGYGEAYKKIEKRIYELNPQADSKKVKKFILG